MKSFTTSMRPAADVSSALRLTSLFFTALFAMVILAACEAPSEVAPELTDMPQAHVSGDPITALTKSTVAVNADGSLRPVYQDEEGITLGLGTDHRPALIIAGKAAYGAGNLSLLRFNVKQTEDGTITGGGAATIYGQEVNMTAECIKPITSFGKTYYGVNVAFAEPLVRTTPWGTVSYTHGAISVADGGDLANLMFANTSGCRAAALLYPYEPESGNINVISPGK